MHTTLSYRHRVITDEDVVFIRKFIVTTQVGNLFPRRRAALRPLLSRS